MKLEQFVKYVEESRTSREDMLASVSAHHGKELAVKLDAVTAMVNGVMGWQYLVSSASQGLEGSIKDQLLGVSKAKAEGEMEVCKLLTMFVFSDKELEIALPFIKSLTTRSADVFLTMLKIK